MSKHVSQVYVGGNAQLPSLPAGHRRCACRDEIPADKWKDHIRGCAVRARKQAAEKARRSA